METNPEKFELGGLELSSEYQQASEVCQKLQEAGFEAYFTGGAVRDLLLGNSPEDFDITTNARPQQILTHFKKSTQIVPAEAYGVVKVNFGGEDFEIATFRKDVGSVDQRHPERIEFAEAEEDVKRRDFTVNGLLLEPVSSQLIDYVGGLKDLELRTIRFIGDPKERIAEDRLRILRAIRFKNRLGFQYDKETWQAVVENRDAVLGLSPERLRDELTWMLLHPSRVESIKDLDQAGILEGILPEFVKGKGIEQPPKYHSEGDVFVHQLLMMKNLPQNPSVELVWAALLHDVGKPLTQTEDERGIHFYGHDERGKDLAGKIMKRLRFSNDQIEVVKWLIAHHINIRNLSQRRPAKQIAILRHPNFGELLDLIGADGKGSLGVKGQTIYQETKKIWEDFQKLPPKEREKSAKNIGLSGKTVIEILGLDQKQDGPLIGKIVKAMNEAYLNGEFKTYQEGLDFIRQLDLKRL